MKDDYFIEEFKRCEVLAHLEYLRKKYNTIKFVSVGWFSNLKLRNPYVDIEFVKWGFDNVVNKKTKTIYFFRGYK